MSDQLIFDLPCYPALGFNDFFVSKANKFAFDLVKNWAHWSNGRLLVIGAKGSGKTHLSNVWANLTNATFENVIELDFNLQNINAIVLENIELAASRLDLEERLLHILNHCSSNRIPVLMTSNDFSSRAGFELKDLNSRLIATEHISIEQPDDALLSAVLIKQFNDRQIQISPSLIEYILQRITRSMSSIGSFVEELDRTILKLGKSANRAMISEVLDKFS